MNTKRLNKALYGVGPKRVVKRPAKNRVQRLNKILYGV